MGTQALTPCLGAGSSNAVTPETSSSKPRLRMPVSLLLCPSPASWTWSTMRCYWLAGCHCCCWRIVSPSLGEPLEPLTVVRTVVPRRKSGVTYMVPGFANLPVPGFANLPVPGFAISDGGTGFCKMSKVPGFANRRAAGYRVLQLSHEYI